MVQKVVLNQALSQQVLQYVHEVSFWVTAGNTSIQVHKRFRMNLPIKTLKKSVSPVKHNANINTTIPVPHP